MGGSGNDSAFESWTDGEEAAAAAAPAEPPDDEEEPSRIRHPFGGQLVADGDSNDFGVYTLEIRPDNREVIEALIKDGRIGDGRCVVVFFEERQ